MNYVCIVGVLVEVTGAYLIINVENEQVKVFYKDFDASILEIGTFIKIEGKITNIGFPFEVVKVEKVYTLKESIN